jgi:hypothetical protein
MIVWPGRALANGNVNILPKARERFRHPEPSTTRLEKRQNAVKACSRFTFAKVHDWNNGVSQEPIGQA